MNVKIAGIIAEYNPLHAGHIYHMEKTRQLTGCDYIVCVMGGCFTQRGEAAIFDKFARAEMALLAGADAVIELPEVYALRPAQLFARGGVGILDRIGADALSFGCETDDADILQKARRAVMSPDKALLRQCLERGESYPKALAAAAAGEDKGLFELLSGPNLLLALEYINECERIASRMEICPVKRTSGYHDAGSTASASGVRQLISSGDVAAATAALPREVAQIYEREIGRGLTDLSRIDAHMLLALRQTDEKAVFSPDDSEGLLTRARRQALAATSFDEALMGTKCKRYTLSRVRRLMMNAVLALPKAPDEIPYIRLLGVRQAARPLLTELKRRSGGRLVSRAALLKDDETFKAECRATELWGLASPYEGYRRAGRELSQKLIVI